MSGGPGELPPERAALLADMVDTMVFSLREGCSPAEAALVVAHVFARVVYLTAGEDATKDDAMVAAVVRIARDKLVQVRVAKRSS